jgi:hypothetical protein
MDAKRIGLVAVAALTLGAGVAGGAAIASAATTQTGTQTPYGGPEGGPGGGPGAPGGGSGYGPGRAGPPGAPHQHAAVTGAALAKVTAAVKVKDAGVTVKQVLKDPDGSYDVFGVKAGKPVMLEVSKDLATVTLRTGPARPPGGPGGRGPGRSSDTPVTGSELSKVTAAVKAKDSAITVQHVRRDPDGSYDVLGTLAGKPVMLEVSKDLATVTEHTGGPGGPMPGGPRPGKAGPPPAAQPPAPPKA